MNYEAKAMNYETKALLNIPLYHFGDWLEWYGSLVGEDEDLTSARIDAMFRQDLARDTAHWQQVARSAS